MAPKKGTPAHDIWRENLSKAKKGKRLTEEQKKKWLVPCSCVTCGQVFYARINTRKYCTDCKKTASKDAQRRYEENNKEKRKERKRAWIKANPEKHRAPFLKWLKDNPGWALEHSRKWRRDNPERSREIARNSYWRNWEKKKQQREANAEAIHASSKIWRQNNLEKDAAKSRRRYAKKRGATGSHSLEEFISLCKRHSWRCFYCGCQLTRKTVTEDHVVPVSKGGTDNIDNIVPACCPCNSRKGAKSILEFIERYGLSCMVAPI